MAIVSLVSLSFFYFLLNGASQATAQAQYEVCNFTATANYKANLDILLANLTSSTQIDYGFYYLSYGQNPVEVSVIGLCRGDLNPDVCRSCLGDARESLQQNCPDNKIAIVFYENCMLRYSNKSLFGVVEETPTYPLWWGNNVTSLDQYNKDLFELLAKLQSKAASGDSRLKFATGKVAGPNFQNIYALVQCTPDLSAESCRYCLNASVTEIPQCCDRRRGVIIGKPSCYVRYGNYLFYETAPPQEKNRRLRIIIAIVVPGVAFITLVTFVSIYLRVRKSRKYIETEEDKDDSEIISVEQLQFNYETIKVATNDFSNENKLGEGGFGSVYKGKLSDGREIAVKRPGRTGWMEQP
ncbi:hypothetical protein L6164_004747 [Bauhinia variegata]|uniref:Uncharacterized protein n=1 Tax=Bauhinia variegata TaxID=167791 RepID=A0ACB9PP77_BAUVA|nr:hypothetical protein L6164_004747 [Bauhinia variegata]